MDIAVGLTTATFHGYRFSADNAVDIARGIAVNFAAD